MNPRFQEVAQAARQSIDAVLNRWLPGGEREGSEYQVTNPTRDDHKPGSFSINTDTGRWADFATGDKGGDLISLVAYLDGSDQGKACRELAEFLGVLEPRHRDNPSSTKERWTAITPIPDGAPPPPAAHNKLGKPAGQWTYHDEAGRVACYVYRFNLADGGKGFRPLTYCTNGKRQEWRWQGLPDPRPLYNAHLLTQYSDATVIVTEGEKAADAAAKLFPLPGYVATTALNGAKSPAKTDWAPLAYRTVWLWPDADEAGRGFADDVCQLIRKAQADQPPDDRGIIHGLRIDWFKRLPDGTERDALPGKWDAADAIAEGFTAEHITAFLANPANRVALSQADTPPDLDIIDFEAAAAERQARLAEIKALKKNDSPYQILEWQKGYRNGVHYFGVDKKGDPLPPEWICSPLRITARTRSTDSVNWGTLLEWDDPDGQPHVWPMAAELTSGNGEEYRKVLLDGGLQIAPGLGSRHHLTTYIMTAKVNSRACCVDRTGWQGDVYVLPHKSIGGSQDRVLFQSTQGAANRFRERGTLAGWRDNVGRLCRGNSRLLFACSVGFAAPLLEFTGDESGGFHLVSGSSGGKTTALRVAGSLYGGPDYLQRWRATDNGLEGIAAASNDALLILDELAQIDPKRAGEVAYMLANGAGKHRANRAGGARMVALWQLLFLSSGEIGLADHMAEAGKRARAGQEVRLIDVPADAGCDYGIFEDLHGYDSGAAFSDALTQAASEHYGTPILAFIEKLITAKYKLPGTIKELRHDFLSENLPSGASGQVHRAAGRFALCAVAGELATTFEITGWQRGEAEQAAARCFKDWLERRGGKGNQEITTALSQVRLFFELHGESRFSPWEDGINDRLTINRAGFRRNAPDGIEYLVFPEVFKTEVCKGLDARFVAKLLVERGLVLPDENDGRFQSRHRLPGMGNKRVYRFAHNVIGGE